VEELIQLRVCHQVAAVPVVVAAVCQVCPLRQVVAQALAVVVYLPAQWGYRHLNRGVNDIGLSEAGSSV
jgi:hypothetical protein